MRQNRRLSVKASPVPTGQKRESKGASSLPDDESLFSPEFDERIRERFPLGSSEDKLIDVLTKEHFVQNGLICEKIVRVFWQADATGGLREVRGSYESHCA
jgi:hypothetical protein